MFSLLLGIIYLSFISLGLPDALLGSAWPTMYPEFNVPISYSGIIFATISIGTIISSLFSDRLTRRFSTGKITAFSTLLTAFGLFGFSISNSFITCILFAIPYGLGAGGVDASINNYVALHYESHHMSWLHSMWGLGATIGPNIMSYALITFKGWQGGYRIVSFLQLSLTLILFISLPLWKKNDSKKEDINESKPLTLIECLKMGGVKELVICFLCYCALEQTVDLWATSYLSLTKGINPEIAAKFGSLYVLGMTIGRVLSGFIAMKLKDRQMIHIGELLIVFGIILLFIPSNTNLALIAFVIIGLGSAPIYPCIVHLTPIRYGSDKSQAIIGIQMAFAYLGNLTMPPLFGIIANNLSITLLPIYLSIITILMIYTNEIIDKKIK